MSVEPRDEGDETEPEEVDAIGLLLAVYQLPAAEWGQTEGEAQWAAREEKSRFSFYGKNLGEMTLFEMRLALETVMSARSTFVRYSAERDERLRRRRGARPKTLENRRKALEQQVKAAEKALRGVRQILRPGRNSK